MHANRARVTPCRQLLLGIVTRECDIVVGFTPIQMARSGRVAVFNIEATRVAYVPVVVFLHDVGLERPVCGSVGRASVPASLWDVIGKCRTSTSLSTGSTASSISSAATSSAAAAATVCISTLSAAVSPSALITYVSGKIGGNECVTSRRGPSCCARVV